MATSWRDLFYGANFMCSWNIQPRVKCDHRDTITFLTSKKQNLFFLKCTCFGTMYRAPRFPINCLFLNFVDIKSQMGLCSKNNMGTYMVYSSRHPFWARFSKICPRRWKYDRSIKDKGKKIRIFIYVWMNSEN